MAKAAEVVIGGEGLVSVQRLSRDIIKAADTLSDTEARFLVDAYYMMQEDRIRAAHQARTLANSKEPNAVVAWLFAQSETLENQIKRALDAYSDSKELGKWARNIDGIGPVIAAGLLAHIDIEECTTAGKVWRFAGLDSTAMWVGQDDAKKWIADQEVTDETVMSASKHFGRRFETLNRFATTNADGEPIKLTKDTLAKAISRRPHNGRLKTLCWKIGESFVKAQISVVRDAEGKDTGQRRPEGLYGKLYLERKAMEAVRNEAGEYKEQAAKVLKRVPGHAQRAIYKAGKLPPGHLHARAKRYVVKIFLAHYLEMGRRFAKLPVVAPYPIAYLQHADKIEPPQG